MKNKNIPYILVFVALIALSLVSISIANDERAGANSEDCSSQEVISALCDQQALPQDLVTDRPVSRSKVAPAVPNRISSGAYFQSRYYASGSPEQESAAAFDSREDFYARHYGPRLTPEQQLACEQERAWLAAGQRSGQNVCPLTD